MIKPYYGKARSALGYIVKYAKEGYSSAPKDDIQLLLFYADLIHLNEYGRPISFDTYIKSGISVKGLYVSTLSNTDYHYNPELMSKSDEQILRNSVDIYYNFHNFASLITNSRKIFSKAEGQKYELRDMFFKPINDEQFEELEFLINHSSRDERDFEISLDVKA